MLRRALRSRMHAVHGGVGSTRPPTYAHAQPIRRHAHFIRLDQPKPVTGCYIFTYENGFHLPCVQLWLHVDTRGSEYVYMRARTHARASAAPPRTSTTPHRAPAERVPRRWRAAAPKAAHTEDNVVTDAVFHAPMFALNATAPENACEPKPHAVHRRREGPARFRRGCGCAQTRTHTRARI